MANQTPDLQQALDVTLMLSPLDKVRLVEQLMVTLEDELRPGRKRKKPRRSLYGLWSDVRISAEEIDEARRELWANFPREDI